jgi:ubiquinone/menaquinone biosynthesis C-methylase UbiE
MSPGGKKLSLHRKLRDSIVPGLINSQYAYHALLSSEIAPGERWLDIGGGHSLLPDWLDDTLPKQLELVGRCAEVVGLDPVDDRPHMAAIKKIRGSAEQLPFPNNSFTLVTVNMVVEHLENPETVFREIVRVLAPGGRFIIHTPNRRHPFVAASLMAPKGVRSYVASLIDGRDAIDIFPTYYRMNTAKDIARLAQQVGLAAAEIRYVESSPFFARLLPLVLPEYLLIRAMRKPSFARYRPDLIVVLKKPEGALPN